MYIGCSIYKVKKEKLKIMGTVYNSIEQKGKETVFEFYYDRSGKQKTSAEPDFFKTVTYLGFCNHELKDVFSAEDDSCIIVFYGIKGEEF